MPNTEKLKHVWNKYIYPIIITGFASVIVFYLLVVAMNWLGM